MISFDSEDYNDLPVISAAELVKHLQELEDRGKRGLDPVPGTPNRFLMNTDEFLKYVNEMPYGVSANKEKKLTRRTLQFYSSPQARLLPLPVYKNRHTAHYIVPEHLRVLAAIWTLRERHNFPIEIIRKLLKDLPYDKLKLVSVWGGTAQEMLNTIPLLKQGFDENDLFFFHSCRSSLFGTEVDLLDSGDYSEQTQKILAKWFRNNANAVQQWIESGRAIKFLKALKQSHVEGTKTMLDPEVHLRK